jgi:CDP-diacylglycerol--glycerol-3-phosphate 3-phosphatidyltransferase
MRIADKFTLSRAIMAPVFFLLYFFPLWTERWAALSVFVMLPLLAFTEFTDYLDGYFARKYNQVSAFGKLFDPFSDVLLHITLFSCLTFSGYMPPLILMLIVYREFTMNFMRLAAMQKGVTIGARKGGKTKTALYVVTVFYSLLLESAVRLDFVLPEGPWNIIALALYIGCVLAAYLSFFEYILYFKNIFTPKEV